MSQNTSCSMDTHLLCPLLLAGVCTAGTFTGFHSRTNLCCPSGSDVSFADAPILCHYRNDDNTFRDQRMFFSFQLVPPTRWRNRVTFRDPFLFGSRKGRLF